MKLALTSQEKKVLGFVTAMVVLGFVMLGIKRLTIHGSYSRVLGSAQPTVVSTPP